MKTHAIHDGDVSRGWGSQDARSRQQGIMLVECLIYIGVLGLITMLAFSSFFSFLSHHQDIVRNSDDIIRTTQAIEQWRKDVRLAARPLVLETNNVEHVLRIRQASNEVAYVFDGREVWRVVDGVTPAKPTLTHVASSRMEEDKRTQVTAWCWYVELTPKRKNTRYKPQFAGWAVPTKEAQP